MARTFDRQKAAEAQEKLCEREKIPMFAPSTGYCFRCGLSIYDEGYISVETAANVQITGCPRCRYSFCS